MKISWVLLTHNRHETAKKCLDYNFKNMGNLQDAELEIIWVDNSDISLCKDFDFQSLSAHPSVSNMILNNRNRGVAKGYNQGLSIARGDYVLITGCDRIMPTRWLEKWLWCFKEIKQTGIVACYSKCLVDVPERLTSPFLLHYSNITLAMPLEARMLKRDLFHQIGYFHEGLGLYGWEDVLWSERAEKITRELGLINYVRTDMTAFHLGDEGCNEYTGKDDKEYHEFKRKESQDPEKMKVCQAYRIAGHPRISSYGK